MIRGTWGQSDCALILGDSQMGWTTEYPHLRDKHKAYSNPAYVKLALRAVPVNTPPHPQFTNGNTGERSSVPEPTGWRIRRASLSERRDGDISGGKGAKFAIHTG